MPGDWSAPPSTWDVVIDLRKQFTVTVGGQDITADDGRILIEFADKQSAMSLMDQLLNAGGLSVRHKHPVVAGEVLSDPPDIPDEKTLQTIRRRQLEYTDTHGGWMSEAARQELEALRDTGEDNDTAS